MKAKILVSIVIAVAALAGCASTGREVSQAQVSQLQKGKTSYQEAIQMFGKPNGEVSYSDGKKSILYTFAHYQSRPENFIPIVGAFAGGYDSRYTSLSLHFDASGVLDDYVYNQGSNGGGYNAAAGQYQDPNRALPAEQKQ